MLDVVSVLRSMPLWTAPSFILTDILEAAGRDPRYLPLLPALFTVPDGNPYANLVDNFYDLFRAESTYPLGLWRCQFVSPLYLCSC